MNVVLIGILGGLGAMIGFGFSDFFAAKAVRKINPVQTLFLSWFISLVVLAPFVLLNLSSLSIDRLLLLKILFYSFNFALGNALFYRALEIGPVSITSPVSSSYPLIAVMVAVLFFAESLLLPQYLAIGLIIGGILLASFHFERFPIHIAKKEGIIFALIAAFLWGTAIPVSGQVIAEIGWLNTLFYQLVFGLPWLYLMFGFKKGGLRNLWGPGIGMPLVWGIGIFYLLAVMAFNFGLEKSLVSIVTPVSATYPLITIALALTVLKEKVLKNQLVGAGIIILGIVFLSLS
ncbi:MAG: DMT family transporter [Patescibacteria group bacterium]